MILKLAVGLALVTLTLAAGKKTLMPGAPVAADSSDTQYLDFALQTVKEFFSSKRGKDVNNGDIELIGSTSQVVAGVRYEYYVLVKLGDTQELCQTSLWVRPWLSTNFVTQLDDPLKCESVDSILARLEETYNARVNNLNYRKAVAEPIKFTMDDTDIKVVDVHLAETTCTKQEQKNGLTCALGNDALPKFFVSSELYWDNNVWSLKNVQMGDL